MISHHTLLTLPIIFPLLGLVVTIFLWRHHYLQRLSSFIINLLFLWSALKLFFATKQDGTLATQFGSWHAPFGISFVGDKLSAVMVLITALMAVVVAVYQICDSEKRVKPMFFPLYHGLLLGVTGAFLTGDIFNLYVWFEIMLIASFGLLIIDGTKEQLDAGVKYVMLNLVMTTLFLVAVAFLYGATGTLNMADLASRVPQIDNAGLLTTLSLLFLMVFASKAALFPLFFWLPASYHTASTPVLAIFAALLTKVGVYAIVRSFTLIFPVTEGLAVIVGVIAMLTMVTGVLGAASHFDIRKILSFHIISQIGYMLIGVAIGTPLALAGSVLYIVHHIIVKANLFLIGGVIKDKGGTYGLKRLGGLHRSAPLLAILFCIPALSLAGLPPLSGFWAKYLVIKPSLDAGHWYFALIALLVGVLTLFSMLKIWNEAFWKDSVEPPLKIEKVSKYQSAVQYVAIAILAAITLCIGLNPEPFVVFSIEAANQLADPNQYINAVFGGDYAPN